MTMEDAILKLAYQFQENINEYTNIYKSRYMNEINIIRIASQTLQSNSVKYNMQISGNATVVFDQMNDYTSKIIMLMKEAADEENLEPETPVTTEEKPKDKKEFSIIHIVILIIGTILIAVALTLLFIKPIISAAITDKD